MTKFDPNNILDGERTSFIEGVLMLITFFVCLSLLLTLILWVFQCLKKINEADIDADLFSVASSFVSVSQ
jgi:hypothetical protein